MDCTLGTTAKVDYAMKVPMACKDFALKKVGFHSALGAFFSRAFGKNTKLGKDALLAAMDIPVSLKMTMAHCSIGYNGQISEQVYHE